MPVARPETSDARVIAHVDMDCFYVQGLFTYLTLIVYCRYTLKWEKVPMDYYKLFRIWITVGVLGFQLLEKGFCFFIPLLTSFRDYMLKLSPFSCLKLCPFITWLVEQRKQPELRGLPTAVVQYNEWQGGALIAVSYEARSCGVKRLV